MKSTIRLFRAVPIQTKDRKESSTGLLMKTLKRGFIFSPEVVYNYPNIEQLVTIIEQEVGLTPEQMNASFHKSWKKVKEASIEQLFLEQIIHYITTYGYERIGIYDESTVYIPAEILNIPEVDFGTIPIVIIKGLTKDELKDKLMGLLGSGLALKEETLEDVLDVSMYVGLVHDDIENIKNKEVKIALYEYLNIVPKTPVEFLRYIVFKATDNTLLIKNRGTIETIKEKKNIGITRLFEKYENEYGLERLATIFFRFKPIFLAFKTNSKLSKYINKLRKLADKYHKPMRGDYLNEVTSRIKTDTLDTVKLKKELERVNIFRKIRLAYALKYRTQDSNSILYRIRNGKGYATNFDFSHKDMSKEIYSLVLTSILDHIRGNVEGKKIYIPKNVGYSLPATEKQFTGYFPSGSYISIPHDMIFGIHWSNVKGRRIDLDLSLVRADSKIGWDGRYRDNDRKILFSGDLTDASKGATELFYVEKQPDGNYILLVNYFNYSSSTEVPFKILVAKERVENFGSNYTVNPNNVMVITNSTINLKQKVLGLVTYDDDGCRFYFTEMYLGNSITSTGNKFVEHARKYLLNFYTNTISLNEVLILSGAELVDKREDCDLNLSPETLEKDTIINLIK